MDFEILETHTAADGREYDIYVKDFGPAAYWESRKRSQLFAVVDRELDMPLTIRGTGGCYHYVELRSARNRIRKILAK
jgi:hypothetical protein